MASRTLFKLLNRSKTTTTKDAILGRTITRTCSFKPNPGMPNNLFSRISAARHPNCSVTPILQQWIEEGKSVSEYWLKHIIRDLRARRRYGHALEVSKWMSSNDFMFSPGDRAVQLDLIGKVHGLASAKSFFSSMKEQDQTVQTYGALLNCYVREGLVDESLSLMKKLREMGDCSVLPYIDIMCLYSNTGQLEKVPDVFLEMKRNGVSPDNFSYRICINSYGARADYDGMEKVLQEMHKQQHVKIEWCTYSSVANYYIKGGLKEKALYYLKKCEELCKSAEGFNHLISLYATLGNKDEMKRLWGLQKVKCRKQTNIEYMTMLGSLVRLNELEETEKLLEEWELSCKIYDFRVPNFLLIGYCKEGLVEKAEAKLRDVIKRRKTASPNSWSIIASGYVDKNNMEKAFECFKEALAVQAQNPLWRPRESLISIILSWLGANGEVEDTEDFVNLLKTKVPTSREMYHALLKAYVRKEKEVERLLECMRDDDIEEDEETMKILNLQHQNS